MLCFGCLFIHSFQLSHTYSRACNLYPPSVARTQHTFFSPGRNSTCHTANYLFILLSFSPSHSCCQCVEDDVMAEDTFRSFLGAVHKGLSSVRIPFIPREPQHTNITPPPPSSYSSLDSTHKHLVYYNLIQLKKAEVHLISRFYQQC